MLFFLWHVVLLAGEARIGNRSVFSFLNWILPTLIWSLLVVLLGLPLAHWVLDCYMNSEWFLYGNFLEYAAIAWFAANTSYVCIITAKIWSEQKNDGTYFICFVLYCLMDQGCALAGFRLFDSSSNGNCRIVSKWWKTYCNHICMLAWCIWIHQRKSLSHLK